MAEKNISQPSTRPATPNPELRSLDRLVGEWVMEGTHPFDLTITVRGRVTFEWLEGHAFLIEHWSVEHPDFPNGIAILGYDEATGNLRQHYFDSRGVARIYNTSLSDGVWRLWRDDPGFSQRFVGTFADNGNTIMGRWKRSTDSSAWEHDFNLKYAKVTQPR
jgi:hypothetical protein